MAHFEDLSPYAYARDQAGRERARNVGWLDAGHPFPVEVPDSQLLDSVWAYCGTLVQPTRGLHACELCGRPSNAFSHHGIQLLLGSGEIRVFGLKGEVFAAPNLIYHYVRDHQYRPPQEFVRVLETGPHPRTDEYVHRLNGLGVPWRENIPVSGEPARFRFVRTENGIEKVGLK